MTEPHPADGAPEDTAPVRPPLDLGEVDLVPDQTSDDTDAGWGSGPGGDADPATVLRRYLDDKPPHHGD